MNWCGSLKNYYLVYISIRFVKVVDSISIHLKSRITSVLESNSKMIIEVLQKSLNNPLQNHLQYLKMNFALVEYLVVYVYKPLPFCPSAPHFKLCLLFLFYVNLLWLNQLGIKIYLNSFYNSLKNRLIHKFQISIHSIYHNLISCEKFTQITWYKHKLKYLTKTIVFRELVLIIYICAWFTGRKISNFSYLYIKL